MNPPRPLVVLFPPPKKKKGNKQTPMTKPNKKIKNKNTHTHKINRWKANKHLAKSGSPNIIIKHYAGEVKVFFFGLFFF